jgi:hypothetical protein
MQLAEQTSARTRETLSEIQQHMRDMCLPQTGAQYDEFYKVTTERGFTRITVPKGKG